jgi:glycosyltransferase involved in cell wall biosynthesis
MYILVTPAKNEERYLPLVAESIIHQTLKPALWLIVDDGSSDSTPDIIRDLERTYPWIKSVHLPPHPRDLFYHYSYVCREGFNYALSYLRNAQLSFNYVGLIDADTVVSDDYFEKLILEFNKNEKLGIASGVIYDKIGSSIEKTSDGYLPRGTGRLWTKECFIETDGYVVEAAAHSISNIQAILSGYEIKIFNHIEAVQLRPTRSAEGLWKTFKQDGWLAYYLNKHPLLVIMNVIYFTLKKPYYLGLPYLIGYTNSVVRRMPKIQDEVIRDYYWNVRLHEYFLMLKRKFI